MNKKFTWSDQNVSGFVCFLECFIGVLLFVCVWFWVSFCWLVWFSFCVVVLFVCGFEFFY